ncbi:MAG: SLC13 family permease [Pseudomonadota bacterium]
MTVEIAAITGILLATVVLLASERIPVDVTALGIMVVLMASGLLSPGEALAGLANPAPVTVAALFVVSRGLVETGALQVLSDRLVIWSGGRQGRLLVLVLVTTGTLSAFVNNTPVVVLLIPLLLTVSHRNGLSPSKLLMPASFMSILAGTTTLIGTSTNIVVSDTAMQLGIAPLGMFELTALGLPLAVVGGLYLYLASPRLLPAHREPVVDLDDPERQRYISELKIPRDSPLIGASPIDALCQRCPDMTVYEVLRDTQVIEPAREGVRLQAGDVVLVTASAGDLVQILDGRLAALPKGENGTFAAPFEESAGIVELIVPPNSDLVGRRLANVALGVDSHVHVIGVKRRRTHYAEQRASDLRLSVGDILLVQAPLDHIDQIRKGADVIVVEDVRQKIHNRRKAPLALSLFGLMIAAASLGLVDILVASLAAALLMLLTGCLSRRAAYQSVDTRTLLLIVGTLALGLALSRTGAAAFYADLLLTFTRDLGPRAVLGSVVVGTSVLSLFLSNTATAVLIVPVAVALAQGMNLDPRPFVVAVVFGASACFASPLGYQTNLLVYGPGGYSFRDYVRLGVPLHGMVWVVATVAIPWLWPFSG